MRPLLLEVAALLECAADPGAEAVATVQWLLTNGCESPLYNPDVPAAQLGAVLEHVATGLRDVETKALARWAAFSEDTSQLGGGA